MVKRVMIAVGGTGGHIYPAVALAERLKKDNPEITLLFAGGGLSASPFFDSSQFHCSDIACGQLPLSKPLLLIRNLGKIASGIGESKRLIEEFRPDLVVGFGSYHSLPLLLAAKLKALPVILHEGNAIPGRVNRLLSRHVKYTAIQFPEAAKRLMGCCVEIAPPLREGVRKEAFDPIKELESFGFSKNKRTLLIFGGSQGAFAINRLATNALTCYRGETNLLQVIHLTGSIEESVKAKECYKKLAIPHIVKDFDEKIGRYWSVADFVIGRSGAGTIVEAMEFEVAALLLPYPYATDDHQRKNGEFMSKRVGGAYLFMEEEATAEQIAELLYRLFEREPEELERLKQAIVKYKDRGEQRDLSALVAEFAPH